MHHILGTAESDVHEVFAFLLGDAGELMALSLLKCVLIYCYHLLT
jgi:hypothetical protein